MSDDLIPVTFDGWVNPLAFLEVDEPWASMSNSIPDAEAFLRYLCSPEIDSNVNSLSERYREISQESIRLLLVPAEQHILAKLVWPLRHAKGSFMVGNYIGTISLCGMVAEMIAILFFEISPFQVNGRPLDEPKQKELFGRQFEKLGQDYRVKILHGLDVISSEQKTRFDLIKDIRNRYLHLYSEEHDELAADAVKAFQAATSLVVDIIGQEISQGKVVFNPALVSYLTQKGFAKITPPVTPTSESS